MDKIYYSESGYLELLSDVLDNGVDVTNDRTGEVCRTIFDAKFVIPEGEHFLVTHRPAPLRLAYEEFWHFLNGKLNTKELEEKGCNFWVGNTSREFLDKRGLHYLPEGHLGLAYSAQWRNAGGSYESYYDNYGIESLDYTKLDWDGTDQLWDLILGLRNDKYSRRHIVTLWNPAQNDRMCLTPCWHTSQYVVLPNKDGKDILHVKLINRSLDVPFGCLYAVSQYRLFQIVLCKMFGFELGKLSCDITNAHIYHNQLEYAKEIIGRDLGQNGTVEITKELNSLEDLLTMEWGDVKVSGLVVNKTKFKTKRPQMVA